MKPSVGRIVVLKLTEDQKKRLAGNHINESNDEAPAIIVKTFGDRESSLCNLKVFGDSENNIWVTSSTQGDQPGEWRDPNPMKAFSGVEELDLPKN